MLVVQHIFRKGSDPKLPEPCVPVHAKDPLRRTRSFGLSDQIREQSETHTLDFLRHIVIDTGTTYATVGGVADETYSRWILWHWQQSHLAIRGSIRTNPATPPPQFFNEVTVHVNEFLFRPDAVLDIPWQSVNSPSKTVSMPNVAIRIVSRPRSRYSFGKNLIAKSQFRRCNHTPGTAGLAKLLAVSKARRISSETQERGPIRIPNV